MNFIIVKLFLFIIIEVSAQFDNSDVGDSVQTDNIEDDFMGIDTIADNALDDLSSADNFLEERIPEIVGGENEGDTSRYADPTLHKWKHKGPLFHSHSHTHTFTHGTHLHETPVVVHPVNYEFSHRPQSIHPPNNHQYVVVNDHGMEAATRPLILNSNQWSESSHQNSHQTTYNQNFHQQNQAIHHQNIQFSNQNNHHFDSPGKLVHSWESANPKIVNINGHSNTFIHSGTSQNFISSHNEGVGLEAEHLGSLSDDQVVGISMPPEEEIHWHVKPENSQLSEDLIRPVVYDSGMNKILEVLDERSYYHTRPETSGYAKHAEMSTVDQPHDELPSYQFSEYEEQEHQAPRGSETTDEAPNDPYIGNIIQIPSNNRCHCYRRRNTRNRRSPKLINMNVLSDNSMNFNISSLKLKEMNSKLNDTLFGYRDMVDDYRKKITDKRELLFADVLDSIIGNFQFRGYKDSAELKKREKRSATITKLLNNPDARLDVRKTLDNVGTITRNAFEDERSPLYHVRQFMGSTKNAVLSAMKIPPQNLVIPSNYEIKNINPEEIEEEGDDVVSAINPKILSRSGFRNGDTDENYEEAYPSDPYGIVETFARVGGAIRDSVRSSQNTLNHISNIAHDARKIFHTTKNTVPRVLLPYAKAPVLTSRFKANKNAPLKKAIIISPKVLDVKDPIIGAQKTHPDFVSMGHILDAIGLTKSKKDHIDLEKIVVKMPGEGETRGIYIPPIGDVKSVNGRRLPNFRGDNEQTKGKSAKNLGSIHDKIVSTNRVVKENMQKRKNDITKNLDKTKNKIKYGIQQLKERNKIENDSDILSQSLTRSDKSNIKANKNEIKQFTKEEENEIIDKFLYNIFKTDANQSAAIVSLNDMNKNEKVNYEINANLKKKDKQNTESTLGSSNIIYSSDILPNITQSILEETIKNITMDLLQDENKKDGYNKNYIKTNTIQKNYSNKRKNVKFTKRPKIVLQSRFGDDEDSTPAILSRTNEDIVENKDQVTDTTKPNITPEFKGLDKNEEEAMRKVDEYVLNDVALSDSSNNEKGKNSWKIDNVLELIEDPSAEESSNELKSEENREENVPVFASRSLLSILDAPDRQHKDLNRKKRSTDHEETVGLNLAPDLMKPFMAVAPNSNIDEVYGYEDENKEDDEINNVTEPNSPTTTVSNSDMSFYEENLDGNADEEEVVGLNYPFTSNEENEYNVENNNNDDQYNSPVLMMPLRTTKSVKKTLDEFLKKENQTKQQMLNAEENRVKHSRSGDISDNHEGFEMPIEEQLYIIPQSDLLKKMISTVSNKENCKIKRCYKKPTNENIPQYNRGYPYDDQYEQQNVVICVCISESSHGPVSYNGELYRYPFYRSREEAEEFEQEVNRNGVGEGRTSMYMSDTLKKPFMGLGSDETIKKYYDEFNNQPEGGGSEGGSLFDSNEEQLLFYDN
ncbi:uncharacterized protein LOC123682417 [Harmonia axyridis]|uniref:uncharacterized protein LOC123682417 n=1 Tax=Harmonia axyridis TaxID=115357 RepID=UPI001E279353|nr:uncharacterized protein LOC123682417 [Harmonia axyridis]